jgi:hypothetical protein
LKTLAVVLLFISCFQYPGYGEEYSFDLSEIEKKPYHIGGYAEFSSSLFRLNQESALYKLGFYNKDEGSSLEEYSFRLQMEGSYETGMTRFFVRSNSDVNYTYSGWDDKTSIYEGYVSVKPSSSLRIDAGKKSLKWGKGYAWNPVAFIDRPKDPDDPELSLEGFIVCTADYIKSFDSVLKTLSFTPVLIPVYEHINDDFGKIHHLNFAAKTYFLLCDTDIDLIFMTGDGRAAQYGIDFSGNISENFEIHGEFAHIEDYQKKYMDEKGSIFEKKQDIQNYLLGIRYLTEYDTTFIIEYFRNGAGYSPGELKDFFSSADKGYDAYLSEGNDALLNRALNIREKYSRNPLKDYLYFRASQKEPFDILYFTPSVTCIVNMNDSSFSLSPELLYSGITNLEMRLKAGLVRGKENTEYGEKQNDFRMELRVRYYF